jgi:outer membrane protein assembly factor BamB
MSRLHLRSWMLLTAVTCGLGASSVLAEPARWPQWRGAAGSGIAAEQSLPDHWSKSENVLWRTPLPGRAGATPCIWDDRIFLTSNEGDDLVLMCVARDDGRLFWKKMVTSGNQDARSGEGNSASPSPSTDGEHVWAFFGTGILACYTCDGEEVWKFNVGDRFGKLDIQFGMTSTPVLDGDSLYLQLLHGPMRLDDQTRIGKVIRLNKKTGETIWEIDRITDAQFECKHSYACMGPTASRATPSTTAASCGDLVGSTGPTTSTPSRTTARSGLWPLPDLLPARLWCPRRRRARPSA